MANAAYTGDPEKDYKVYATWDEYYKDLKEKNPGITDSEIRNRLSGTSWSTAEENSKFNQWARGVIADDINKENKLTKFYGDPDEDPITLDEDGKPVHTYLNGKPGDGEINSALDKDGESMDYSMIGKDYDPYKSTENIYRDRMRTGDLDKSSLKDTQKRLREDYANDNKGYKQALADRSMKIAEGRMGSIWDAYENGQIDKSERNYLIFDAISKAMSKSGDTLAAIAAAYTGGTANFGEGTPSLWEQRMAGVNEAQTSAAQRNIEDSAQEMEKETQQANLDTMYQELHKVRLQLQPAEYYAKIANDEKTPPFMRNVAMLLSASSAGNDQDMADYGMGVAAGLGDEIKRRKEAALKENPPRELSDFEASKEVLAEISQLFSTTAAGALTGIIQGGIEGMKEVVNETMGGNVIAADGFEKGRNESDSINKTWNKVKLGTPYNAMSLRNAMKQAKKDGWWDGKGNDKEFIQAMMNRYEVPEGKASFEPQF